MVRVCCSCSVVRVSLTLTKGTGVPENFVFSFASNVNS